MREFDGLFDWLFADVIARRRRRRHTAAERWTAEQANDWYDAQPWLVGCNFLPQHGDQSARDVAGRHVRSRRRSTASWVGRSRSASTRCACSCTTCPGRRTATGSLQRVDEFLEIAAKHKIRPLIVFFDGVWDPDPQSGLQRRPRTGVHNSGWVQSPGRVVLADPAKQDALKPYVSRCAADATARTTAFSLGTCSTNRTTPTGEQLRPAGVEEQGRSRGPAGAQSRSSGPARSNPTQPLTVGVWRLEHWDQPQQLNQVHRAALELSDVISFHDYGNADSDEAAHRRAARPTAVRCSAPSSWPAATAARSKAHCRSSRRSASPLLLGAGRRQVADEVPVADLADADPRRARALASRHLPRPTEQPYREY